MSASDWVVSGTFVVFGATLLFSAIRSVQWLRATPLSRVSLFVSAAIMIVAIFVLFLPVFPYYKVSEGCVHEIVLVLIGMVLGAAWAHRNKKVREF